MYYDSLLIYAAFKYLVLNKPWLGQCTMIHFISPFERAINYFYLFFWIFGIWLADVHLLICNILPYDLLIGFHLSQLF